MANAAAVQRQVLGAITSRLTEVAIDLITLTHIDSAGLRVLFTLGTRLETLQIALQLLVPTASTIEKMIEFAAFPRSSAFIFSSRFSRSSSRRRARSVIDNGGSSPA